MTDPVSSGAPAGRGPLLIVVGSGSQIYREYILRAAAARYRCWLMQPSAPTWQRQYLAGYSIIDNTDPNALVAACRDLTRTHEVAGVLCYDEGLVWPSAYAAEALGVTGNPPDAVRACRDKHATRSSLAAAGIRQPLSRCVATLAEARKQAADIGYPVVLKPRGLAGSKGVQRVDRPEELDGAYTAARAASYPGVPVYQAGVLVEEFVTGPEISVDAVFYDGACVPLVVARKQVGFDPYFEELGHLVDPADPLLTDPLLRRELERSHAALGFRNGVTHTEFKLDSGRLRLIEVNARLGGDLIPYLGLLSRQADCALAAADVAAGRRPEPMEPGTPAPARSAVAGIRFLYPERDTQVESVEVSKDRIRYVHTAKGVVAAGQKLRLPPRGYISRYGFVIAVADTGERVAAVLQRAPNLVTLRGRPLPID